MRAPASSAKTSRTGAGVLVGEVRGDHVIPLTRRNAAVQKAVPSARKPISARDPRHQGKGLMPDGTSRFSHTGKTVFHYMGISFFLVRCCSERFNFTVAAGNRRWPKSRRRAVDKSCYIGARPTGRRTQWSIPPRSRRAQKWSCSARRHRAQCHQGARMSARQDLGVDTQYGKGRNGPALGMTHLFNPLEDSRRYRSSIW